LDKFIHIFGQLDAFNDSLANAQLQFTIQLFQYLRINCAHRNYKII